MIAHDPLRLFDKLRITARGAKRRAIVSANSGRRSAFTAAIIHRARKLSGLTDARSRADARRYPTVMQKTPLSASGAEDL
ncbi:MAG: hypothetical protein WCA28_33930 [Bradyrhizobium sp.]